MMRKKWVLRGLLAAVLLSIGGAMAAVAIPGPQRLLAPGWFGFEEIAPGIYGPPRMASGDAASALEAIDRSKRTVSAFFGYQTPMPMIVLCPEGACTDTFGDSRVRGIAYGKRVIRLNDAGINRTIATHELMHTALKSEIGEWRGFFDAIPAWFDEGLAVLVSDDPRFDREIDPAVIAEIKARHSWRDWGGLINEFGWRDIYGGAVTLVRDLEREIGRDGLRAVLTAVSEGADFETALREARSGA